MMRLRSDILPAMIASHDGVLSDFNLRWTSNTAVTVVMASPGYPGPYRKGEVIRCIEDASEIDNLKIFHAGTGTNSNGEIISNGGRVLGVTAVGYNKANARKIAYGGIEMIDWPTGYWRHDIGGNAAD